MAIKIKLNQEKWRIEIDSEEWEFEDRKDFDTNLKILLDLKQNNGRLKQR